MGLDERLKSVDAGVALARSPNRVDIGRNRDELIEVFIEGAVIDRRKQQAGASRSTIGIVQDGESREMNTPTTTNAMSGRVPAETFLPLMSSPIARSRARAASLPGSIGVRTVRQRGVLSTRKECTG